jgi:hypothetical protein
VAIKSRAVLTIAPGKYELQTLDLEPQARININGSEAVSLLVNGSLIWRGSVSGPIVLGIFNAGTTHIELLGTRSLHLGLRCHQFRRARWLRGIAGEPQGWRLQRSRQANRSCSTGTRSTARWPSAGAA